MFNKMCCPLKNRKGFTLVELLVVVVIIGILVAIAVPVYKNIQKSAMDNAAEANIRIIQGAIVQWQASDPDYAGKIPAPSELNPDFIQEWPTGPGTTTYSINSQNGEVRGTAAYTDGPTYPQKKKHEPST